MSYIPKGFNVYVDKSMDHVQCCIACVCIVRFVTFQLASSWNSMILMNPPIRIPGKEKPFNPESSPANECCS